MFTTTNIILAAAAAIVAILLVVMILKGGKKKKKPEKYEGEVNPNEVVIMTEAKPNGLVMFFSSQFKYTLKKKPYKYGIVLATDTSIGIEDIKTNTAAVTITIKDGKITVQNGIIGKPKIYIGADPKTLMELTSLKIDLKNAFKDPATKALIAKMRSGEIKLRGLFTRKEEFGAFNALLK